MQIQFTAADPTLIGLAVYFGLANSFLWFAIIPIIIIGWFADPRWNKKDGFRFWR